MIYIQSLMKINTGIEPILRFCLGNLKGCIVGITDRMDLWSAPLKWTEVA
jgi:hypothetical protein